jgi:cobalamin-dependent methionine synthase I
MLKKWGDIDREYAMWPASSVSGYYFGNPSKYFGLGR